MTAAGRLWRRAPLWRIAVIATFAGIAMTALFPPRWPGGAVSMIQVPRAGEPAASPGSVPGPARTEAASVSQPNGAPGPRAGTIYSGRLPLGPQSVRLPVGQWLTLAVATGPATSGVNGISAFLVQTAGGRIIAAAAIAGSAEPDAREAGYAAPLEAQIPSYYYRRVVSAVDRGPLDFWICGIALPAKWTDPLRQAALGALHRQNVTVPDRFDSAVFRFADKRNWLSAEFMYPAEPGEAALVPAWTEAAARSDILTLPHIEKVRRWGKRWHDAMRHDFSGDQRDSVETLIPLP